MPSFYELLAVVGDIIPYYLQKIDNLRLGIAGYRLHPATCWARYHAAISKKLQPGWYQRYLVRLKCRPSDESIPGNMKENLILYYYNYKIGRRWHKEQEPIVEALGGQERLQKILRGPPANWNSWKKDVLWS